MNSTLPRPLTLTLTRSHLFLLRCSASAEFTRFVSHQSRYHTHAHTPTHVSAAAPSRFVQFPLISPQLLHRTSHIPVQLSLSLYTCSGSHSHPRPSLHTRFSSSRTGSSAANSSQPATADAANSSSSSSPSAGDSTDDKATSENLTAKENERPTSNETGSEESKSNKKSSAGESDSDASGSDSSGFGDSPPVDAGIRPVTWYSLGLLTVGCALALFSYRLTADRKSRAGSGQVTSVGRALIGGSFDLFDLSGAAVKSADLHGSYSLIYFGFTHCPDVCPTELKKLEAALELLKSSSAVQPWIQRRSLIPVFISIDPRRDTPKRLEAYSNQYPKLNKEYGMKWLTGPIDSIRSVARSYRVYFSAPEVAEGSDEDYLVDHSIFFYLVDRQGEVLDYMGKNLTAAEMAEKIERAIGNDGKAG